MKRAVLIIQTVLIYSVSIYAQENTWETIYSTPMNELAGELLEAPDGSIYIAGFQTKPNEFYGHSEGLIIKLDKWGTFDEELIIGAPERRFSIMQLVFDSNDSIIAFGTSTDTIRNPYGGFNKMKLEFRRLDMDLNILQERTYSFPTHLRDFISEMREGIYNPCLLYTSPSPRDRQKSRMPSSA
jgi:hypothetical protein